MKTLIQPFLFFSAIASMIGGALYSLPVATESKTYFPPTNDTVIQGVTFDRQFGDSIRLVSQVMAFKHYFIRSSENGITHLDSTLVPFDRLILQTPSQIYRLDFEPSILRVFGILQNRIVICDENFRPLLRDSISMLNDSTWIISNFSPLYRTWVFNFVSLRGNALSVNNTILNYLHTYMPRHTIVYSPIRKLLIATDYFSGIQCPFCNGQLSDSCIRNLPSVLYQVGPDTLIPLVTRLNKDLTVLSTSNIYSSVLLGETPPKEVDANSVAELSLLFGL